MSPPYRHALSGSSPLPQGRAGVERRAAAAGEQPTFIRQQEILTPEDLRGLDVDVVGAGALGGAIVLCLLKMGFGITNRVTLVDFDRCAEHNLPNQWFRRADAVMGLSKVEAVVETADWLCEGRDVVGKVERFRGNEGRRLGPLLIIAVDSLAERHAIWQRLRLRDDVQILIDARMGAEVLEVYSIHPADPDEVRFYETSLADPEEAVDEPCTRRAVMYTTLGAAGFVGSLVRAASRGDAAPRRLTVDFRNFMMVTA